MVLVFGQVSWEITNTDTEIKHLNFIIPQLSRNELLWKT